MSQEYSFTLTVPLVDLPAVDRLMEEARQKYVNIRISRKTDRAGCARLYLSFPFSSSRADLAFQEWFNEKQQGDWELFGPTYGRWGLV